MKALINTGAANSGLVSVSYKNKQGQLTSIPSLNKTHRVMKVMEQREQAYNDNAKILGIEKYLNRRKAERQSKFAAHR